MGWTRAARGLADDRRGLSLRQAVQTMPAAPVVRIGARVLAWTGAAHGPEGEERKKGVVPRTAPGEGKTNVPPGALPAAVASGHP